MGFSVSVLEISYWELRSYCDIALYGLFESGVVANLSYQLMRRQHYVRHVPKLEPIDGACRRKLIDDNI
jgi:hypothetical protein